MPRRLVFRGVAVLLAILLTACGDDSSVSDLLEPEPEAEFLEPESQAQPETEPEPLATVEPEPEPEPPVASAEWATADSEYVDINGWQLGFRATIVSPPAATVVTAGSNPNMWGLEIAPIEASLGWVNNSDRDFGKGAGGDVSVAFYYDRVSNPELCEEFPARGGLISGDDPISEGYCIVVTTTGFPNNRRIVWADGITAPFQARTLAATFAWSPAIRTNVGDEAYVEAIADSLATPDAAAIALEAAELVGACYSTEVASVQGTASLVFAMGQIDTCEIRG